MFGASPIRKTTLPAKRAPLPVASGDLKKRFSVGRADGEINGASQSALSFGAGWKPALQRRFAILCGRIAIRPYDASVSER